MTLKEVKKTYNNLIALESKKLAQIKKTIFQVGTVRLLIVLGSILLCYLLWGNAEIVVPIIGISIVFFLFLMKYHNKLFFKKRYCEILILNAENELKALDYDFSSFDGAPEMSDGDHSYSMDLDLFGDHSFFQSINRTVTFLGKNKLANTLLYPFEAKDEIIKQQEAIQELTSKPELLHHFRAVGQMTDIGDLDVHEFSKQFKETKLLSDSSWRYLVYIAPALFAIIVLLSILQVVPCSTIGGCWAFLFLLSLVPLKDINLKIGLFNKRLDTLQTYSRLFKTIETETFSSDLLKELQQRVTEPTSASVAIHKLKSHSNNLDQSSNVLGLLVLNPILFWNVAYAIKIEKWIGSYENNVKEWFSSLARFDSLVSFALFSYNHPDYTFPQVADTYMLAGKELGHPLLNRHVCVRNDLDIEKHPFFLVVTGANMAGKSTYLRTIGLNLVLACSGAPVCANSLTFYPFKLVTNLRTSDSLTDNESYFFAELKRLKMIIDRLQSGEPLFIILDEILKGTNSEDKQKGSIALMKQLVSLNGNGIIATHDLILGNLEKEFPDAIKNYRFEADIKDEHLSFTYKIREGVAQNMNASFLMKKMGITGLD